jgi:archaellum biogenesis protein FlaJ (TadC family)
MSLWLSLWAIGSMAIALVGFLVQPSIANNSTRLIVQAIAAECLFWGLIEVGFALAGMRAAQATVRSGDTTKSSPLIRRLLTFSLKLNWIFLLFAIALISVGIARHTSAAAGHGIGILLQCGFLLLLDRHFLGRFHGST